MDTASGAPQAYPSTPGLYHLTAQAEGHTVYYTLRIPASYDGHTALPVILCLHFGGQPTELYGGRFLNLIPGPGFGSLATILVAPTTAQSGWNVSETSRSRWPRLPSAPGSPARCTTSSRTTSPS